MLYLISFDQLSRKALYNKLSINFKNGNSILTIFIKVELPLLI